MIAYNTLIVLVGTSLLGACAGLVGAFAVLRRRALTGDALAHAALPGLCLAFLLVGYRSLPAMLVGALISGLVGIAVISVLTSTTRIKEDAAIGIVLSVFFGAGVVLSRLIQNRSHVGSKAGLDSYILGKTAGMIAQDIWLIGGVASFCLLLVLLLYKEFKVVSFDPGFAKVQGWPALTLDLLLMSMVALAVVIGLPAVGVVLMAALLIIPPAAARFWTDRLEPMLLISAGMGMLIGAIGTTLSSRFSLLPAGPVIVLVGSFLFVVSLLLAPHRGLLARWFRERGFHRQVALDELLRVVYEIAERNNDPQCRISEREIARRKAWSGGRFRSIVQLATKADLLAPATEGQWQLTPSGEKRAAGIVLTHRLWDLVFDRYGELASGAARLDREVLHDVVPSDVLEELEQQLAAEGRHPIARLERT